MTTSTAEAYRERIALGTLEQAGFTVKRNSRGIVVAVNGPRRIYGATMVSVLETSLANYVTPKKGS